MPTPRRRGRLRDPPFAPPLHSWGRGPGSPTSHLFFLWTWGFFVDSGLRLDSNPEPEGRRSEAPSFPSLLQAAKLPFGLAQVIYLMWVFFLCGSLLFFAAQGGKESGVGLGWSEVCRTGGTKSLAPGWPFRSSGFWEVLLKSPLCGLEQGVGEKDAGEAGEFSSSF